MKEKYLWVIGGGQLQIPLIIEANKLGLKTIVSDYDIACVAKKYADIFAEIDIFDIDAHITYLKSCELNIVGVLAAGIDTPETMAAMNEYLGLKGVSLKTALLVKNKDQFRLKLQELGYPTPEFKIITQENINQLQTLLESMPYPLIVKPSNNSASRDMKIFQENSDELHNFIKNNIKKYQIILVEEMFEGEEQTVECLVDINGRFHNGFITDRKFTFENGFPVELGLVHPTELPKNTQRELFALAKKIAHDLKIDVGAVKLDTITTQNGLRIIELTVRHSGGYDCQYLVPRSRGKNILKAAILTAIGEVFESELLHDNLHRFGVTGSVWPQTGVITEIRGLEEAKQIEGVEEIFFRYTLGDTITPYIDCASRVAFIICSATSREEANEVLSKAIKTIQIKTQKV